jgi:hypothetical protein
MFPKPDNKEVETVRKQKQSLRPHLLKRPNLRRHILASFDTPELTLKTFRNRYRDASMKE